MELTIGYPDGPIRGSLEPAKLFIDRTSQSMLGREGKGTQPLAVVALFQTSESRFSEEVLKTGLKRLVQAVYSNPDNVLGLLGYREFVDLDPRLPPKGQDSLYRSMNRQQIEKSIDAFRWQKASGRSPQLPFALKQAIDILANQEYSNYSKHIILYSDGLDKEREEERATLYEAHVNAAYMSNIIIHRIYRAVAGAEGEFEPDVEKWLDRVAGAKAVPKSPEDLPRSFESVSVALTSSQLLTFPLIRPSTEEASGVPRKHQFCLTLGNTMSCSGVAVSGILFENVINWPANRSSPPVLTALLVVILGLFGLALFWRNLKMGISRTLVLLSTVGNDREPNSIGQGLETLPQTTQLPEKLALWLYSSQYRLQKIIDKTPFVVGNDIDCDWVLPDLDNQPCSVLLRFDFSTNRIYIESQGQEPQELQDRQFFDVGEDRLYFFIANLS